MNRLVSFLSNALSPTVGEPITSPNLSMSNSPQLLDFGISEEERQVEDFLNHTALGSTLRIHLQGQLSFSSAPSSPMSSSPMSCDEEPTPSPNSSAFDPTAESLVYNYWASHLSEATREMVEYGDAALATSCGDTGSSLHLEPSRHKQVWEGQQRSMFYPCEGISNDRLPRHIQKVFTKRWRMACKSFEEASLSSTLKGNDEVEGASTDEEVLESFPFFLSRILPGWCAMLEIHASQWSESLRCRFVETCVLPSLLVLKKITRCSSSAEAAERNVTVEKKTINREEEEEERGEHAEGSRNRKMRTRHRDMAVLVALQRLLHFLHLLLLRGPASSLSAEQSQQQQQQAPGEHAVVTAVFLPGALQVTDTSLPSSKKRSLVKLEYLVGGKVSLELLSFFSLLSNGARRIFDGFSFEEEEEGCDLELTAEAVVSSSFYVAISIVSLTFPHSELSLVVRNVLTAVNVMLYRFTHLRTISKPLMYLMLRQIVPGTRMIVKAMEINPTMTVRVLMETEFHVLMADALRVLGQAYESHASSVIYVGGGDDFTDAEQDECVRRLNEFAEVPSFSGTTLTAHEPTALGLVPGFHRFFAYVAEDEMANDFLSAFHSLRLAQRSAMEYIGQRRIPADILSYFRLLDGIVVQTLISTDSTAVLPTYHDDEEPAVSESCMAGFFCRYLVELLSWTDLGGCSAENKAVKVQEWRYLVDQNVYGLLLHHEWMQNAMKSNKRVLYAVGRIFYVLVHYSADSTASGFTIRDQQEPLRFLLQFVCDPHRIRKLMNISSFSVYPDLHQELFPICCGLLSHCFHGPQDAIIQSANEIKMNGFDKELLSGCVLLAQLQDHYRQPTSAAQWFLFLSESLLEESSTFQARALLLYPDVLIGLVCETHTRFVGSRILIHLLQHYTLAYVEDQAAENSITGLVYAFWGVIAEGRIVDDGAHAPPDNVLALLHVMNTVLDTSASDRVPRNFYTSRSHLQDQFCGPDPRCFVLLMDFMKAASTLRDPAERFHSVSTAFRSLFYFVRGNNELRRQLTKVINAQDFFQLCQSAWQPSSARSSFASVVQSVVHFVYEDDGDPVELTPTAIESSWTPSAVLNPPLLVPVVLSFSQPKYFDDEYDVLLRVMDRLTASTCSSPTECYFLAKAGILNALSRILPLCVSSAEAVSQQQAERTLLFKKRIVHLMALIAAQQIDVRHIKQLVSTNLIYTDYETRRQLLPVVAEVFSTALQLSKEKGREPQSYIAFRPNSGRVGVRAEIAAFPVDGYAVSMWFHCEAAAASQSTERTLFTMENAVGKSMMKCFINGENILCVSSLDKYKNNVETVLGASVYVHEWSHIVVIHHRPGLLQTEGAFEVFLNGVSVAWRTLRYPQHDGQPCRLYIGSPGDAAQIHRHTGLFVGQVTNIYFFPKPLTKLEANKLFSTSLPHKNPIPYRKGSYEASNASGFHAPLQYNLGEVVENERASAEMILVEKASIFVDPRVGDENHLYNVAYFLQESKNVLEKPLMMYEGTVVVSGTSDILESLCLSDAVYAIIMPMLALLVDARLPFPLRWTSLASSKAVAPASPQSSQNVLSVLFHIIDITISLSSLSFMRECLASSGVFVLLCYVLERVAPYVSNDIPERIMYLCQCFETRRPLFGRVYAALFLCSDTIRALPVGVQRKWWQCQVLAARTDMEGRGAVMRSTGIQMFAVQEILYRMQVQHGVDHELSLQEELLHLLDVLTAPPITQGDANPLFHLLAGSKEIFTQKPDCETAFTEILFRVRLILHARSTDLARYLSQAGFMGVLFSLLSLSSAVIRREAILMTCLLLQRSTGTQRLMNPALIESSRVDVVHSQQYVDLSWLGPVLSPFSLDTEGYMTLRSALTGDRITRRREVQYKTLSGSLKTEELLPHMLFPLSQQLVECAETEVKVHAAIDIANLIQNTRGAARKISSLSGWYRAIIDLYCSHDCCRVASVGIVEPTPLAAAAAESVTEEPTSVSNHSSSSSSAALKPPCWQDKEMSNTNHLTSHLMMENCAAAIGACLLQVMRYESYGAAECREVCGFMYYRGAHALLNRTLNFVAAGLLHAFATKTHEEVMVKDADYTNLFQLFYIAEDYMFCAHRLDGQMQAETSDARGSSSARMNSKSSRSSRSDFMKYLYMTRYTECEESEPEGWLHLPLALHLCLLLCTHKSALKEEDDTVMDWITGHSAQDGYRKGGLSRLFTRWMRVAASFTLRCVHSLDSLLEIAALYVAVVHEQMHSLWKLRPMRVLTQREGNDIKSHSAMANTMSLLYIFHDLLIRRMYGVQEKSNDPEQINERIITVMKQLFSLFSTEFLQLLVPVSDAPAKGATHDALYVSTEKWFADIEMVDLHIFTAVSTRGDYRNFLDECFAVLQEGRLHEAEIEPLSHKAIEDQCVASVAQLDKSRISRDTILGRLRRYEEEHRWNHAARWSSEQLIMKIPLSSHEFSQNGRLQTTAAMRSSVWALFRARIKGSMWWPSTGMQGQFTRLSLAEQQWHCHRKLLLDDNGTDHRDAARQRQDRQNEVKSKEEELGHSYSELNLFDTSSSESERESDEDHNSEEALRSRIAEVGEEDHASAYSSPSPLFRSFPCEMIYMLQSWSATLTLDTTEGCVIVDEENQSHNSPVAKDAEKYVIRPESTSFPLNSLTHIAPGRRYRMKRTGLELWFRHRGSLFINFPTTAILAHVVDALTALPNATADAGWEPPHVFSAQVSKEPSRQQKLSKWRSGAMSNFDYLMWLNFLAGRSTNDFSQYPIFPWVLSDYESEDPPDLDRPESFRDLRKPIGVVGKPDREAAVLQRYEEQRSMHDAPAAHYYSHYSSPSVMTFFLLRLEPFTSLHLLLQGGTFDFAERMFHSVASAFRGVTTNIQDVRELIPELYYLPELCFNFNKVPFGVTSHNIVMNDLVLPPWAHGCPYEFIYRMREALESDYVSMHLHHWIDLIFGCKQKGKKAVEAMNVFQWYTYEDLLRPHVDAPGMTDFCDNMGQTPIHVFRSPHPERRVLGGAPPSMGTPLQQPMVVQWVPVDSCAVVAHIAMWSGDRVVAISSKGTGIVLKWSLFCFTASSSLTAWRHTFLSAKRPSEHDDAVSLEESTTTPRLRDSTTTPRLREGLSEGRYNTGSIASSSGGYGSPAGAGDAVLSVPSFTRFQLSAISEDGPCVPRCTATLSFMEQGTATVFAVQGGLLDNTVVVRPLVGPNGKHAHVHLRAHHGHVTHVAVSEDSSYICTGARDTTFVVWYCAFSSRRGLSVSFQFIISSHDENPGAVALCRRLDLVVTASVDGVMFIHSLSGGCMDRRLRHPSEHSIDHVLIQHECYVPNILFASDVDSVIHQMSINGVFLRSFSLPGKMNAWCCGVKQNVIIAYTEVGSVGAESSTYTGPSGAGAPSISVSSSADGGGGGTVVYVHAFFLTVLHRVVLPSKAPRVTTMASDSSPSPGSQTVLLGTKSGMIGVLQV